MCWHCCVIVGRWSPCPVLPQPNKQPHPRPLPVGEGSEYPCFLLEDGARRPLSYLSLQKFSPLFHINTNTHILCSYSI